jgi:spore maturation protein CgeB
MAPNFDLYATTYPEAIEKSRKRRYNNVVLTQWAANSDNLQEPMPASECHWDVSFVGMAYGGRMKWIAALKDRGIHVHCFGHGWKNGIVPANRIPKIIQQSVISLNFGDSNWMLKGLKFYKSRQIKARVFEVTGCGGFLMTDDAENLDNFFKPEQELVLFDHVDELARKIKYFLAHPDQRDKIAQAGYARTRQHHTYVQRFEVLLQDTHQLIASRSHGRNHTYSKRKIDYSLFDELERLHQTDINLRLLKMAMLVPCNLIWGPIRGPRAARRILFELSWRLCGEKTYTASGWPGRLFYRES